ncbi:hypothetical protein HK097_006235, partial [Rhizophlyctis rosea]
MRTTPHYDPFLVNPRPIVDPAPYTYDSGALPGVIDPRGEPPDVPFSTIVHTHIKPTFARKTDLEEFGIPKVGDANAARVGVESIGKWMNDPWSSPAGASWEGLDDEEELGRLFGGFAGRVKELVSACCADPKRFIARLNHTSSDHAATLTFVEIIRDYRETELLTIDFIPAPWSEIVENVTAEYERAQAHNTLVKTALMQALELVARYEPGLLLAQNPDPPPWEMYPAAPSFGKLLEHLTSLDPASAEEARDEVEDRKVIYEKAFPVYIRHSQPMLPEQKLLSLSLTFTHSPPQYTLTLTDPADPFIHHQSKAITPTLFKSVTSHFTFLPTHSHHSPDFTPTDPNGFLSFLKEELIGKVILEPTRYKAFLEIHASRWENQEEDVLMRKRTPPMPRLSTLRFEEKVSRWDPVRDVVRFEFGESEWDVVGEHLKNRVKRVWRLTETTTSRLSRLLTLTLHSKNTTLLTALHQTVGKLPPILVPNPPRSIRGATKAQKVYHNHRYPSPERPPSSASIMLPPRENRNGKGCFIPVFAGRD